MVSLSGLDTAEELGSPGADLVFQSGRTDSRAFPIKFISQLRGSSAGGTWCCGVCLWSLQRMCGQPKEGVTNLEANRSPRYRKDYLGSALGYNSYRIQGGLLKKFSAFRSGGSFYKTAKEGVRLNSDTKTCTQGFLYLLSGYLPSFHPCKILGQTLRRNMKINLNLNREQYSSLTRN